MYEVMIDRKQAMSLKQRKEWDFGDLERGNRRENVIKWQIQKKKKSIPKQQFLSSST